MYRNASIWNTIWVREGPNINAIRVIEKIAHKFGFHAYGWKYFTWQMSFDDFCTKIFDPSVSFLLARILCLLNISNRIALIPKNFENYEKLFENVKKMKKCVEQNRSKPKLICQVVSTVVSSCQHPMFQSNTYFLDSRKYSRWWMSFYDWMKDWTEPDKVWMANVRLIKTRVEYRSLSWWILVKLEPV